MIKSTTTKSNEMFGKIREACKYGPLMIGSMPSDCVLANKRVNTHGVYCDQFFMIILPDTGTTYRKDRLDLSGRIKFRLYRNDLHITTSKGDFVITDLDRYYVENPTITIQKTDPAIWKLCDDIIAKIK